MQLHLGYSKIGQELMLKEQAFRDGGYKLRCYVETALMSCAITGENLLSCYAFWYEWIFHTAFQCNKFSSRIPYTTTWMFPLNCNQNTLKDINCFALLFAIIFLALHKPANAICSLHLSTTASLWRYRMWSLTYIWKGKKMFRCVRKKGKIRQNTWRSVLNLDRL